MTNTLPLTCCFCLVLLHYLPAAAQYSSTIRSDRPGQGMSPNVAGKFIFQAQAGVDIGGAEYGEDRLQSYFLPNLYLRYGLSQRIEVNASIEYLAFRGRELDVTNTRKGINGYTVGGRVNILKGDKKKPDLGAQLSVRMPLQTDVSDDAYPAPKITVMLT